MTDLFGKMKGFYLRTLRYCIHCDSKVTYRRCPRCGSLKWWEMRRIFYYFVKLDVFEREVVCGGDESTLEPLLSRVGISFRQDIKVQLKGLQGSVWFDRFIEIERNIERTFEKYYISAGRTIGFSGTLGEGGLYVRRLIQTHYRSKFETEKYVKGSQRDLLSVVHDVLPDYEEELELWGDIPVLRFKKKFDNEQIEIGIRAPVAQYGKAYHLWLRVNDVHMYPARPVPVGGASRKKAWVYRVYHTKSWKENIEKHLKHFVGLEEQIVRNVRAARNISVQQVKDILPEELPREQKESVISRWEGGSLWDLVDLVTNLINRDASVKILKKYGFLSIDRYNVT